MKDAIRYTLPLGIAVVGWAEDFEIYECTVWPKRVKLVTSDSIVVWNRDGVILNNSGPDEEQFLTRLLAYRPIDGTWTVIDAGIVHYLPNIDKDIADAS